MNPDTHSPGTRWTHPGHYTAGSWKPERLMVGSILTDKKIAKYQKLGFYSQEYRDARRDQMIKKGLIRPSKREGSFLEHDGRMIYSPL